MKETSSSAKPAAARAVGPTAGTPGKTVRTTGRYGAVQAHGGSATGAVHDAAERGVSGAGSSLPHGEAIQMSFGHHDISGIQSHQGAAASQACDSMGAMAYATGTHVAFKGTPDLHTAAHEAAHVIQQRGVVQLAGGVGRAGDRYERHADAVADAVVAGQSAEGLLDQMASPGGGSGGATAVQHLREDEEAPDPGGQCRDLTPEELARLLARIVAGTPIRPSEQRNVRVAI
ncbi:MAG: DUF4157 domain-containing protein, partial [Myxococcota bacterium]